MARPSPHRFLFPRHKTRPRQQRSFFVADFASRLHNESYCHYIIPKRAAIAANGKNSRHIRNTAAPPASRLGRNVPRHRRRTAAVLSPDKAKRQNRKGMTFNLSVTQKYFFSSSINFYIHSFAFYAILSKNTKKFLTIRMICFFLLPKTVKRSTGGGQASECR